MKSPAQLSPLRALTGAVAGRAASTGEGTREHMCTHMHAPARVLMEKPAASRAQETFHCVSFPLQRPHCTEQMAGAPQLIPRVIATLRVCSALACPLLLFHTQSNGLAHPEGCSPAASLQWHTQCCCHGQGTAQLQQGLSQGN